MKKLLAVLALASVTMGCMAQGKAFRQLQINVSLQWHAGAFFSWR